jgi:hypothetical protein
MFKTIFRVSFALCVVLAASGSYAQQAPQPVFTIVNGFDTTQSANRRNPSVNLPVLGFALDQTGALRPLIGIAGSASVGAPLDLGFGIVRAAIPPNHDYVLAMTPDTNWPLLLQVHGNTITIRTKDSFFNNIDAQPADCYQPASFEDRERFACRGRSRGANGLSRIDSIALSPTGSVAAFFSQSEGRIYAFSNLSQSPVSLGTFEAGGLGTFSAFGISDDAQTVVFGVSDGDAGSVYLINPGQSPRLIASIHHPAAIQFLRNSDGAVIADDLDNRIYALSGGQIYSIAGAEDGIATPAGIAISSDNQRVFVGNSGSGSVTTIGLNGTGTQSMSCKCTLTGLQPMSADSVFQMTDFSGGPILLFDGNSATPRMIFVPVGAQF